MAGNTATPSCESTEAAALRAPVSSRCPSMETSCWMVPGEASRAPSRSAARRRTRQLSSRKAANREGIAAGAAGWASRAR